MRVGAALLVLFVSLAMADPVPGYKTTKETLQEGNGATVEKSDTVTVHATGTVKQSMKKVRL